MKNPFNKKQRLALYKEMLKAWKNNHPYTENGVCRYIYCAHITDLYVTYDAKEVLPELYVNRNAVECYPYWFYSREERIAALEETIQQMTAATIKQ